VDALNHTLSELQPESFEFASEAETQTPFFTELENPFSEAEEMELAVELLEVTSEAELEQFLGNLFKKAWRGIKKVGSKIIRPLGGVLKAVAKKALPFVATAAGTFFGGPAGGAIVGKLGSLVSQALEAETAGVAAADRDLEKCRQFVRMAGKAAKAAALAPPSANPVAVAQKVLANSAQEKITRSVPPVPGPRNGAKAATAPPPLSKPVPAGQRVPVSSARQQAVKASSVAAGVPCSCAQPLSCQCGKIGQNGRWVRRGRSIVIINC
jgi:hypothetical protein